MSVYTLRRRYNRGFGRNHIPSQRIYVVPGTSINTNTFSLFGWLRPNSFASGLAYFSSNPNGSEASIIQKTSSTQWQALTFHGVSINQTFTQSSGGRDFVCFSNAYNGPNTLSLYQNGNLLASGGGYTTLGQFIDLQNPTTNPLAMKCDTWYADGIYRNPQAAMNQYANIQSWLSIHPPEVTVPSSNQTAMIMCPVWMPWKVIPQNNGVSISPSSGVGPTTVNVSTAVGLAAGLYNVNVVGTTQTGLPSIANLLVDVLAACPVYSVAQTVNVTGNLTYGGNMFLPISNLTCPASPSGQVYTMAALPATGNYYAFGLSCDDNGLTQWGQPSLGANPVVVSLYSNGVNVATQAANSPGVLPLNYRPTGTLSFSGSVSGTVTLS